MADYDATPGAVPPKLRMRLSELLMMTGGTRTRELDRLLLESGVISGIDALVVVDFHRAGEEPR